MLAMYPDNDDVYDLTLDQIISELMMHRAHLKTTGKSMLEVLAHFEEEDPEYLEDKLSATEDVYLELLEESKSQGGADIPAVATILRHVLTSRAEMETVLHYMARILAHLRSTDPDGVIDEMQRYRRETMLRLTEIGL